MSRTIEVLTSGGEVFEVGNIPSDAKITFGAVNPGSKSSYGSSQTLRIYRGARADNGSQLAVFQDVVSFRDKSLTLNKPEKKLWIEEHKEQ